MYRGGPDFRDDGTVYEHSRVIEWQRRTISESYREYKSTTSVRTSASKAAPSEAGSAAPTEVSKAPSVARSVSAPAAVPQATPSDARGNGATQLLGTLLGAAAGAAVAYAFVRSEQDSAKKESDFSAFMEAKKTVRAAVGLVAQASSQPQAPPKDPPLAIEAAPPAPQSVHRNIDAQSVHSSTPPAAQSVYMQRQIEAAPPSYYAPSSISRARTQVAEPLAIEYEPAYSVAPSKAPSRLTVTQRSYTSPEPLMIEKARSVASTIKPESVVSTSKRTKSVAHSVAPSSLISSFVPDQTDKKSSVGSVHSHHSSRSKARSSHSHASRHTSSRRDEEESSSSPTPPASNAPSKVPPKVPSKAASLVNSVLGRNAKSSASKYDEDLIDDLDIAELTEDDFETVVPSDSISNVGSSRSHRTHRSHRSKKDKDAEGSVVSKHSSMSKHSKHSHRSHRSHKSRSNDSSSDADEKSSKHRRSSRPSVFSEPSDASTVKPIRSKHQDRKDSLTQPSEYDGLFDQVQYGTGNVAVRGITPSMISAANKNHNRSMIVGSMAQKMRNFEGSQAR